jgi:hypothetical protein
VKSPAFREAFTEAASDIGCTLPEEDIVTRPGGIDHARQ